MLADGGGLYLLVNPDGSKYWRMSYRFDDAKPTLAFGTYPDMSLLDARKPREKARGLINEGSTPHRPST